MYKSLFSTIFAVLAAHSVRKGKNMKLDKLNPRIYSAAVYDRKTKRSKRPMREAENARIIYIFSGDVSISVGDEKSIHLASGSLVYIPASVPFALKGQYVRAAMIAFDPSGEASDGSAVCDQPFDKLIHIDEFESVWDDVERVCELFLAEDEYSVAKATALFKLLLVKIAEASDERALPLRMNETLDQYIRDHAGEEISNTEIGAIFGYHPFYVSTVIKEKRGVTLRQYVISQRLRMAKNLLEFSDNTIAEIAEQTGFTDASYFTKSFKAAFGETPKEWRAKIKEDFI